MTKRKKRTRNPGARRFPFKPRLIRSSRWSISDMVSRHDTQTEALREAKRLSSSHGVPYDVYQEEAETGRGWVYFVVERQGSSSVGNPASVIPLKWTPAKVRVNAKGQVQVAIGRKHAAR